MVWPTLGSRTAKEQEQEQSVSLSQVGVQSKRLNESGWFLAQELPLTCTKLCH